MVLCGCQPGIRLDFSGHYTVYGPKATAEAAFEEMHDHEANPGSSSEIPHDKLDALTADLIDKGLQNGLG